MSIETLVGALYSPAPRGARNVSAADVLRVWLAMADAAEPDGSNSYRSRRAIADDLGVAKRTVENATAALVVQGRIVKTADAVPRVRGDTYRVVCSSGAELGRGIPGTVGEVDGDNSAGDMHTTRPGDSAGGLGRGFPGTTLTLTLKTPPTPPCRTGRPPPLTRRPRFPSTRGRSCSRTGRRHASSGAGRSGSPRSWPRSRGPTR